MTKSAPGVDAPPVAPAPPPELAARGRAFWVELHTVLEFNPKETALLGEACRTLDTIDALAGTIESDGLTTTGSMGQTVVHPAVPELRQQQAGFNRLMSAINLPDDDAAADRFRTARAKAGAAARWERPRAVPRG
jgi:hypothetical protein